MKRFKIDYSFLFIILIIFFSPKQSLLWFFILCLIFHEIGHLVFIGVFKYKIKELKLSIFGFFLKLDNVKEEFYKDLIIYSGGIIFNFLAFLVIPDDNIKLFNLVLIFINIIPIYPLDGFNIFKSIVSFFFPYYFSLKITTVLSIIVNFILFILMIIYDLDVILILNILYLLLLNIRLYFQQEMLFQRFLLQKRLYSYEYPNKTINFHENIYHYLFKYHTITMKIKDKLIKEKTLLNSNL